MKKILIADANKASLVMTSEIFKDNYPGVQVFTAFTSADAVRIAADQKNFDAFVIDFDLPDANGAHTALKIKKFSKKPVLITAFENQEILNSLGAKFDQFAECKNFLKKPLQAEIVHAICEFYCKGNIKFQKTIFSELAALAYFILPSKPKKSLDNSQSSKLCLSQSKVSYLPIIIEECSLNSIKFRFCSIEINDSAIKSLNRPEVNEIYSSEMKMQQGASECSVYKREAHTQATSNDAGSSFPMSIPINGKIGIKFQDPYQIELGQQMSWDQIKNIPKKSLLDRFQFELIGKVVEKDTKSLVYTARSGTQKMHNEAAALFPMVIDKGKSFWVEFEDILLSRKIFEALLREKMNRQFRMPTNGLY